MAQLCLKPPAKVSQKHIFGFISHIIKKTKSFTDKLNNDTKRNFQSCYRAVCVCVGGGVRTPMFI